MVAPCVGGALVGLRLVGISSAMWLVSSGAGGRVWPLPRWATVWPGPGCATWTGQRGPRARLGRC